MPDILKPDLKSLVWLGLGFMVLPRVFKMAKRG